MSTKLRTAVCLIGLIIGCSSDKPLISQDPPRGEGALTRVMADIRVMGKFDQSTVGYRITHFLKQAEILKEGESIEAIVGTQKEDEALAKIKEQFQNTDSYFYRELGLTVQSRNHIIQKIDEELAALKTYRGVASQKEETPIRETRRPIGGQPMFY